MKVKKPRLKVYRQLWAGPHLWIKLEDGTRLKFDSSDDVREYAKENGFSKKLRIVFGVWHGKPEKGHTVDASFWEGPLPNRGKYAYPEVIRRLERRKQKETENGAQVSTKIDKLGVNQNANNSVSSGFQRLRCR